ncbi:unnamed protein product, partial [Prorocentrum cordatum]
MYVHQGTQTWGAERGPDVGPDGVRRGRWADGIDEDSLLAVDFGEDRSWVEDASSTKKQEFDDGGGFIPTVQHVMGDQQDGQGVDEAGTAHGCKVDTAEAAGELNVASDVVPAVTSKEVQIVSGVVDSGGTGECNVVALGKVRKKTGNMNSKGQSVAVGSGSDQLILELKQTFATLDTHGDGAPDSDVLAGAFVALGFEAKVVHQVILDVVMHGSGSIGCVAFFELVQGLIYHGFSVFLQ